jgi:hypothetical protein
MSSVELLRTVYEWLPRLFVLDVLAFHLLADHPIAARTWLPRRLPLRRMRRTLAARERA